MKKIQSIVDRCVKLTNIVYGHNNNCGLQSISIDRDENGVEKMQIITVNRVTFKSCEFLVVNGKIKIYVTASAESCKNLNELVKYSRRLKIDIEFIY